MISQKAIQSLGSVLRLEYLTCISCLTYNKSEFQLQVGKSKFQKFLFLLNNLHLYCYVLLNTYSLVKCLRARDKHSAVSDLYWLLLFGITRSWYALTRTQVWIHKHEIVFYFNSLIKFANSTKFSKSPSSYSSSISKIVKSTDWTHFVVLWYKAMSACGLIIISGMIALKPNAKQFLYYYCFPSGEIVFPQVVGVGCFDLYSLSSGFILVLIDEILIFTMHVLCVGSILSKLNSSVTKYVSTIQKIHIYNQLNIISKLFGSAEGKSMAILYAMFGIMWMMGVVGVNKLHGVVNFAEYFGLCVLCISGAIILFGTIHLSGNIPMKCDRLIKDLRFSTKVTYIKIQRVTLHRRIKALTTFGIEASPVRLLRHKTIYLYFASMLSCIVTFLVAFPNLKKH